MKDKVMVLLTIAGLVFQFALVGFLCFLTYITFMEAGVLNEMLLGVLTGLASGIGLANLVTYATGKKED